MSIAVAQQLGEMLLLWILKTDMVSGPANSFDLLDN